MLSVEELRSRIYEERIVDVMNEIPVRSSEWTNYNPSDPGITILENMTAFSALQGEEIVTVDYRAKMALLKMAGFLPTRSKCSKLLLSADQLEEPMLLRNGERFFLGDLCFETTKETSVGQSRITGVFAQQGDEFKDLTYLLDREINVSARIFGEKPKAGNSLYFIMEGNPSDLNEIIFYIKMVENERRNKTEDRQEHIFADIEWECYTDKGFTKMHVRDFTSAFINSGEIRLTLPQDKLKVYEVANVKGYCIRATLTRADYDIVPKMTHIFSFLFEVWQKDTKSFSQTFNKNDKVRVTSPLGRDVYYLVFGKEKKGSSYRRYELTRGTEGNGRYCNISETDDGSVIFSFSEENFGFRPLKGKECVRVIIYSEEIMRRYNVGKVIGYDDQEIELPVKKVVNETFFLIARRKDAEGYYYDFVRPEKKNDGDLYYHLLEGDGKIIIEDPGDYIDADLFMGSVAVMSGDRGNISAGNYLSIEENRGITDGFYNPGPGTGGCYRENLEQVKERFQKDVRQVYRAITAEDYEYIVKTTPGLCIRKVKAVPSAFNNNVKVVVLMDCDEQFPKLSDIYVKKISERLEERRLITTSFSIIKPSFVAIGVKCTVYVKRHYADTYSQVEEKIRQQIDYINSDRNFGDALLFEDVFSAIENLDCVDYVYNLSFFSENSKLATLKEYDIIPRYDVLCYPGDIQLEVVISDK
ncbi:MAG: baseplate J/gp47 family protein [Butyrivibrio sp.]|uniref:baseplate J/gp47 family protein n=1 Tax=Butyrivibrio sp. TaxID=28121 RepID=UPI001B082DB8|nr:baseplate J/gp47 family protein [Butyrivibrio sp.]MBO6241275.1 baseplate J/gp47 family protein [Butyrivibrio sp.]